MLFQDSIKTRQSLNGQSHVRIPGNEMANQITRHSFNLHQITNIKTLINEMKKSFTERYQNIWQMHRTFSSSHLLDLKPIIDRLSSYNSLAKNSQELIDSGCLPINLHRNCTFYPRNQRLNGSHTNCHSLSTIFCLCYFLE